MASEIHIEFVSSDASAGVVAPVFEAGSTQGSLTLTSMANQVLAITNFRIISVPGGAVKVESRKSGVGTLTLFAGTVVANGGGMDHLKTPFFGVRGGSLTITSPNGVVNFQAEGFLTQ